MASSRQTGIDRKGSRWLLGRQCFQLAAGICFLALILYSQSGFYLTPDRPAAEFILNLPLWLDPLAMISKIIASRDLVSRELLFLVTIILTLVFGRVWCGWFCPLGSLQDWLSRKRTRGQQPAVPGSWRVVKSGLLIVIFGLAAFSNLSGMVFDPLTIFFRSMTMAVLPAVNRLVTVLEKALIRVEFFRPVVSRLDGWIRPHFLPYQEDLIWGGEIFGLIFLAILILNLFQQRFYCRNICPLGALLGFFSRFSLFQARITESCSGCQKCLAECPSGAIENDQALSIHPSECTMCMICPPTCPGGSVEISTGKGSGFWGPSDPGRRTALIMLGAVALGAGTLGSGMRSKMTRPYLLRPPGADEEDLLQRCLRCGECAAACPSNAIQFSFLEYGLEGIWTPILVPRIGYCDLSCNACGQVCPVGAIPYLSLEQKKHQVIGKAYLNKDRCIAWADQQDCLVCEEMCPLPEKAISLEIKIVPDRDGENRELLLPVVDRRRCVGCGVCENKCPLSGEAAIRVHVPPRNPTLYASQEKLKILI